MNCIKCNNPIPDGAKFCPSCGASFMEASNVVPFSMPAPEPEKRYFCEKCGLELTRGVKFCSVCGGAAYAKDVSPIPNSGDTYGEGNMSAVSLDKLSGSNALVSAMNTAAAAADATVNSTPAPSNGFPMTAPACASAPSNGVPMTAPASAPAPANGVPMAAPASAPAPSNAVPMAAPTSVPTPVGSFPAPSGVPMPAASGFNSGYTAPAPSFAPSANAADAMGGFGASTMTNMPNYGSGAAAAVKPIKKKHKGRVALIIIAAVVALLGTVAVLFFTNRAAVLSTVLGKSKYAAMVEGTHIKQVTEKIDIPAVAKGIKSASSLVPLITNASTSKVLPFSPYVLGMTDNISGSDNTAVPMSYDYGSNGAMSSGAMSSGAQIDLSSIEKMYAELLQSTYGKNCVNGSIKAKVEIGDSLKAMMGSSDLEQVNEVLKYLNDSSITYSVSANENAAAFEFGTEGKYTINAKVLMDGQDMYISLPFVSDKAIKFTFDKPAEVTETAVEIKPLELDEKELERIIGDIVQIYLDNYKDLEIEMGNGELTAAGVTVSGKLITAEFSEKDIFDLAEDIGEYIANDDYLAGQIVDFANSCGAEIDKKGYSDAILSIFDGVEINEDSTNKFIINTVINRNGDVLGKSFDIVVNEQTTTFAYANTNEQTGYEMKADNGNISLLNEKTDDANGTCTFKVSVSGTSISLVLKYSDVKETQFCGKKTVTGKFELSMKLPEEFGDMLGKEAYAAMNGAKITLSLTSDSENTMETSIGLIAPGYLDVNVTETVTALDDSSNLTAPSDPIDFTPMTKGEYLDDASAENLIGLIKDTVNALNGMGIDIGIEPGDLDRLDPAALTGKVSKEYIDDFLDTIDSYISSIESYIGYMDDPEIIEEYTSIENEFKALADKIRSKNYNITQDEFSDLTDEFYEIYMKL